MNGLRVPTVGVLLATGLAAGMLAYTMSRRAAREERAPASAQQAVIETAKELSKTEVARAGREYISERVVPELKPVLLDLLKDLEAYIDRYFQKAEKAIKAM